MNGLVSTINNLKGSLVGNIISARIAEFKELHSKSGEEWFSELCFCLLTANSKASTALKIQEGLGAYGFINASHEHVKKVIMKYKHRFHNNKANYIVEARQHLNIKAKILEFDSSFTAREWLVEKVKGLGFKEASHFLRNVGYEDLAILDRHILNLLYENNLISEVPNSLPKKKYYKIEEVLKGLALKLSMSLAELDLYMWYLKTGKVLK
jgi:N-glycosylase/DNA lyase